MFWYAALELGVIAEFGQGESGIGEKARGKRACAFWGGLTAAIAAAVPVLASRLSRLPVSQLGDSGIAICGSYDVGRGHSMSRANSQIVRRCYHEYMNSNWRRSIAVVACLIEPREVDLEQRVCKDGSVVLVYPPGRVGGRVVFLGSPTSSVSARLTRQTCC